MRVRTLISGFGLCLGAVLIGCGNGTTSQTSQATTGNATVNFVVTDTPPTNVTVLSFQVQITDAVLQPGNVSILPRPVTADLAQLVSDTGLLASTVIGSGTYTSLTMTYANPQITFVNNTAAAITLPGLSCAAGATCTFVPTLNNASVTISSGVFPLTVTAGSTTGLNLDLSIPDLLQTDLSVTLANGTSVNLSLLPQSSSSQQAEIDDVFGTITQVSGTQVNMTTAFGDSLVLTSSGSTKYNYPSSVCATPTASCLAVGHVVTADLSLLGNGGLSLNTISFAGSSGSQLVKGLVLSSNTNAATLTIQLLLQRSINTSSLSPGQIASVSLPSGTSYGVGTAAYPGVSGGTFTSALDLLPGQEVVLNVASNLTTGTSPTFNTSSVYLESSQLVGQISAVNSATSTLSINGLSGLFTGSRPIIQQMNVKADATTTYVGFTSSSFSALTTGKFISAKGPLFNTTGSSGYPTIGAIQLRARTVGN